MNIKDLNRYIINLNIKLILPKYKYLFSFYKFIKNKKIEKYSKIGSAKNLFSAFKLLKKLKKQNETYFIILKNKNKFVGTMNLFYFNNLEYEIGISINPIFQKKGYSYNLLKLIIDNLMIENKVLKFHFLTYLTNYKAINLADKLGFKFYKIYKINDEVYTHFIKNNLEE